MRCGPSRLTSYVATDLRGDGLAVTDVWLFVGLPDALVVPAGQAVRRVAPSSTTNARVARTRIALPTAAPSTASSRPARPEYGCVAPSPAASSRWLAKRTGGLFGGRRRWREFGTGPSDQPLAGALSCAMR